MHDCTAPIDASATRVANWPMRLAALAAALTSITLAGCAVYATPQPVAVGAEPGAVYAPGAPPAPVQETITVQPAVGMVWLPGFWYWGGSRYVWRNGYWGRPPVGHSRWAPGYWQHTPRGYMWHGGRWHR